VAATLGNQLEGFCFWAAARAEEDVNFLLEPGAPCHGKHTLAMSGPTSKQDRSAFGTQRGTHMSGSSSSHFLICSCNARLFLPSGFTSAFLLPSITQLIGSGLSPCGIVGGLSASSGLNSSSSFRRFWSSGHVDAFSAALAILTNHCQHRLPSRHGQRCGGCGRDGRSLSRRCSGPREDGPLGCRGQPAARNASTRRTNTSKNTPNGKHPFRRSDL
jgi:hypothetical protein